MRSSNAYRALLVLALCLPAAACGGSSSSSPSSTTATATTAATSTPAGGTASVTSGPVRGALRALDHAPLVNKAWPYTVTVADAAGKPLSGTVDIEFVFGGQVVGRDTPPTHPIKDGRWADKLTFPAAAVGQPLTFRAVVRTNAGSITLDWPVKVRR